ncbi:hypothetical protein PC121_g18694 [Phytophthora cactorum]|nr:hypothetical protein PC120_g18467 [Phytophthora cactorum]KAG3049878.1 hypothetical protein PC121_g18694 [Phytophthora cactorum]KAG4045748.1 hypothetical protein PC123_g18857 [Phytophthora cactorum]
MTGSWEGSVGQYVAIGKRLKADGHCVRLATNAVHRDRIVKAGLLSYPLGGSPTTITTFLEYIHQQAKDKKRHQSRLLNFPACVEADILTPGQAFRSDVIIAHPNLFGQTIVAERLGGPLHCMSDAPLSRTQAFPRLLSSSMYLHRPYSYAPANAASYDVIDNLVWESMGDILDEFRYSLGLTGKTNANNLLSEWRAPHTYLWNSALLPMPQDWRSEITVTGRIDTEEDDDKFADIEQKLQSFDTGNSNTPTIYFGLQCDEWDSHRVQELVTCLEKAAKTANVRIILQRCKNNNTGGEIGTDTVLEIDHHFPMKRILPYVKAAVHWGDLSTTSACLAAAKPACVVHGTSTQRLWGQVLALSGAGVQPLEIDSLTPSNLVRTFETLLDPKLGDCAKCLVPSFSSSDALEAAVSAFYSNLPLTGMTCDLDPTLIARIYDSVHELKLSYEARLVVHQITGDGGSAGDLKYKPLKYSSHHPPKFSLRQLDTERLRSLSRSSSPTYQPTVAYSHDPAIDALDVVEMPKFWSSPEEKTKCMKKINAKHEQVLVGRGSGGSSSTSSTTSSPKIDVVSP